MLNRTACLLVALAFLVALPRVARAEDDNKAQLVHMLDAFDRNPLSAMAVDKLMTLKLSPEAWTTILDPNSNKHRQVLRMTADTLIVVALNMGWGDLKQTDRDGGYDGKSPLLPPMVDSWKGKLSCSIEIPAGLDDKGRDKAIENLEYILSPMQNSYYCKPRSGKFLLSVSVDAKAPKMRFSMSKDASQFHFVLPAYATISQSDVENCLRQGL